MKRFELNAKAAIPEIFLYGVFGTEINSTAFQGFMIEARSFPEVDLKIHSRGGDPDDGLAIISSVQESKKSMTVNTVCMGLAASFGSVVFALGHKRKMSRYGKLMIHQCAVSDFGGQTTALREMADHLDTINDMMAGVYAEATGKTKEWVLTNWMAPGKDTWFTAEEALAAGLATEIIDGVVKPTNETNPVKIAAHFDEALFNSNQYDMKLSMYIPGLNKVPGIKLTAEATDAEIHAAMDVALGKTVTIAAELEAKTEELETKDAEIAALKTSTLKEKAEVMVEACVGSKITADEKGFFTTMAAKDTESFEATKKQLAGMPSIQDPMRIIAEGKTDLSGRKDTQGKPLLELGYKELFKDHGKFLAQLRKEQPEVATQKYVEAYGVKPSWATA